MDATKYFDRETVTIDNESMTEIMPSTNRKIQLQLHLQASEDLRDMIGNNIIKEDLRREFARRIFYLQLATPGPVEVHVDPDRFNKIQLEDQEVIRDYTRNIEDIRSKVHMYVRPLHLAPEVGYLRHDAGINLRFKLALSAIEASNLLAPPFDVIDRQQAYAVTSLPNRAILPSGDHEDALNAMRGELGAYDPVARRRGIAHDHRQHFYVSRPAIRMYPVESSET